MNTKKVLMFQINASSGLGGGSQVMWDITKELRDSFSFKILAPEGEFLEKYENKHFSAEKLSGSFLSKVRKIRQRIKKEEPSIVHVHGTRAAFWVRFAVIGLKNKPKVVYTLHGFHIIRKPFFIKWPLVLAEKFLNYWTDVLVCVSEADKELVLKYKTISPGKIRVIKNGIDLSEFEIAEEKVKRKKEKLGVKKDFVITSIARLHPQKDIATLVKSFKRVVGQIDNENIKLLIVGDGPLRNKLEQKVKNLNLNDYVQFLGFRENTPLLINLSDVIVLSTNWEGLPLVPLEAGASKKSIVASDVGGVKETIKNEKTGLLFEKGNAKELAEKIMKLYNSESLRKELGQNAYKFVSEKFTVERMVNDYKQLYNGII